MAAASAWQLSQKTRVLIVSLDPAHNLGDIFGVNSNGKKKQLTKSLFFQEIDLHQLSKEYLQKEIDVLTTTYSYLKSFNLDKYFSTLQYSPGIEEYALLTSIAQTMRNETSCDYILFDTPPTGLTLRFLALPQVTMTWIDRLTAIRRQILKKRHTIYRIKGSLGSEETLVTFKEEDDQVVQRLRKLQDTYQELDQSLRGPDCHIVLVFNPDVLSVKESQRLITGLRDLGLPLDLLIDNKVSVDNQDQAEEVEKKVRNMVPGVSLQRIKLNKALVGANAGGNLYDIDQRILPDAW